MKNRLFSVVPVIVLVAVMVITTMGVPSSTTAQDGWEPMSWSRECDGDTNIQSIEAVDELTVKFTLCNPDPALPSKVAFSAHAIYPTELLESTGGGGDELLNNPIGTGPYRLENWERGESITMTAFEDYWGDAPGFDTLVFRWNAEGAARYTELQAGTVQGIDNPTPDDYQSIRDDENLALYDRPGTNVFYIGLNNWMEPLNDKSVRQALAMAVDRQRLVDNFYPVGSIVASQFMPPVIFGYTPEVSWYEFDPETAATMVAEAGYADVTVDLAYRNVFRSYLPEPALVAADIAAQLEENLGWTVNIVEMESGAFIDASNSGDLTIYLLGWGADYPDATNFLDFHFGANSSDQFGDQHDSITEPLAQAGQLLDQDARYELYIEANTAIKDEVPMIPVAHGASATAFAANVEGAHASPLGNEYFAAMSIEGEDTFVWMQNAEPISLFCADESDGETLRACEQIQESLLSYEVGGTAVVPSLAESFEANENATEYTFHLREGVLFHDGSTFDANDVVLTYVMVLDANHPLHVGRVGDFYYFDTNFGIVTGE